MAKQPNRNQVVNNYLNYIYDIDYKERPPTMDEFLNNPTYLGNLSNGGKTIYPVWRKTLRVVAKEDSKYIIVLTGCIGGGKTVTALRGILYGMCRILCLKDPWAKFGLDRGAQMSIVFFNLTKSQSESLGYKTFQSHLLSSPWFRERGILGGTELNPKLEFPLFKYTFASPFVQGFGAQGEHIIFALLDEVDSPTASEAQKEKVISACENARRRFESRFVIKGETLGRIFLVASKQERLSFLNAYIAKYKNSKNVIIVDIPLWEAKPASLYCGQKFSVSVGDVYNSPKILNTEEDLQQAARTGYQIIQVPIEYYDDFAKDCVGCLTGDTKISLLSGEDVAIKNLVGRKDFWVYSSQRDGKIILGRAHSARKTFVDAKIIKVILDNGESIKCTEDHLFMLRNGEYKEAGMLKIGDSLMPFYKKGAERGKLAGYEMVFDPLLGKYQYTHWLVMRSIHPRLYSKKFGNGFYIHHRDFNYLNNSPSNLCFMSREDHAVLHTKLSPKWYLAMQRFRESPRFEEVCKKIGEATRKRNLVDNPAKRPEVKEKFRDPEFLAASIHKPEAKLKSAKTRKAAFALENTPSWVEKHRKRSSKQITEYNKSEKRIEKITKLCKEGKVGFGLKTERQIACQKNNAKIIRFTKICPYCGKLFENVLFQEYGTHASACKHHKFGNRNHKVASVEFCGYADVYDITVEKYHNFALTSGIFVHNSLRDLGGISSSHARMSKLFPSESIISKCYENTPNPVKKLTIEIGLKDNINLLDYIDLNLLRVPRNVPRYIHVDFAFSGDGDACGLGMSCVEGWKKKNAERPDGTFQTVRVPAAHTDFAMRIKGKPGDKIPLHLIRKLILDLKGIQRYNIVECTFDLLIATESDKQILERAGIACDHFSVDKNPQYYRDFSNLVAEERWSTPFHPYLHFELKNLEDDPEKNKIDHPKEVVEIEILKDGDAQEVVMVGSKDLADVTCASVINAIQKSTMPPDVEIMADLMAKIQPKKTGFEDLWWVNSGVEKKKEVKPVPVGDPNTTYLDLLKKARSMHRTF